MLKSKKLMTILSLSLCSITAFTATPVFAKSAATTKDVICPAYFQVDANNPMKFKFYDSNMQPYSDSQLWAVGNGTFSRNELYKFTNAKGDKGYAHAQQDCYYQLVNGQKTAGVMSMPVANLIPNTLAPDWQKDNSGSIEDTYTCNSSTATDCPFSQVQ